MANIRTFALVVVDDFDNEIDRFDLNYAESPKNLGFEIQFTTLESRLTTYITGAKEKKLPTTLTLNFLPPNAYQKAMLFKGFVQKYMNSRTVLEYNDTIQTKYIEGKIQKFGQEELLDWGGLVCPVSFLPSTPKYIKKNNTVNIIPSVEGKSYPFDYPYSYGEGIVENDIIDNTYFDEIPLRVTLHGVMSNPQVSLQNVSSGEVYSIVRFEGLYLSKDEHIVIDAIRSKILLYRYGTYISGYDYISKRADLDSFLYAKGNTVSRLITNLDPKENGYLTASYHQYTL